MKLSLSPERWKQVQRLFDEVVDLGGEERAARLDEACRDDPDLREEVDSFLRADAQADDVLQDLDQMAAASPFASPASASRTGSSVARYEVLEKLGSGGMGVVYKAFDSGLKRTVALKFLPPHLHANPEARQRFEHEAQAASALDHPNICTIHEIGEAADGQSFIAMACYEGETLKQKIERDGLTVVHALDYAVQMARGLERAHEAGIIHRDIKPANVIVTDRGVVKILDFGLAKMADIQLTQTGTTIGTVLYMSPEQARGERVDHRTDLWSLGVVLYEMLTDERPFKGDYAQAVIYAIQNEAPTPMTELRSDLPPALAQVVARCLQKGKERRYETASALLADLEAQQQHLTPSVDRAVAERAQARARRNGILAGVVVLVALLLLVAVPSVRQAVGDALGLTGLPAQKHLVVLPLASTSGDAHDAAFTDGLVETVVGSLSQLERSEESLWVVLTDKVQDYGVDDPGEARSAFGVNLAITVGVERSAEDVRVTMDLVDAEAGRVLRNAVVVQPTANLAALRGEMVLALATLLDVTLTPPDHRTLTAGATDAPGAYEFYTQGLGYLQRYREGNNLDAAITLFERALERDSLFALAYAGLGEAYWRKYEDEEDVQWAFKAEWQCERAIELNDRLTPVHVTLGLIRTGSGRHGSAIADFRNALARDSANVAAYGGLASAYEALGRLDDAEAAYKKAIALKPDYWGGYRDLGVFYFNLSRYEEAIVQFRDVVYLTPFNARGYSSLGALYFYLDRRQEALAEFQKAIAIEPDHTVYSNVGTLHYYEGQYAEAAQAFEESLKLGETSYFTWGYLATSYEWAGQPEKARPARERAAALAEEQLEINPRNTELLGQLAGYYAYLGEPEKALPMLERVMALTPTDPEDLSRIAETYERLGERDQALTWIEKALAAGYALVEINDYPGFQNLRADPRFQDILQRVQGDAP